MAIIFFLPSWFTAYLLFRRMFPDFREAVLAACVTWGLLIVFLTEVLSTFSAFSFVPLLAAWALVFVLSIAICVRFRGLNPVTVIPKIDFRQTDYFVPAILICGVVFILLATLVVALMSPPNNWDSMSYHMARVANWIDHRSVRHYPTDNVRQLFLAPWAEFAIAQLQILSNGDRFAACVQFISMLGSVAGVSLVAKKFGADGKGQLFAAIFCATIPMGILQASSTQNDYVASFWLLCFLNFIVDIVDSTLSRIWHLSVLAGASLGLAMLTKNTSVLFAAPFMLWCSFVLFRKNHFRSLLPIGLLGVLALSINAGLFMRNYAVFHSPLGPRLYTRKLTNEIHTPAALASNVIRNVALHFGVPKGLGRIKSAVMQVHRLTGLDINDRRTTFTGIENEINVPFDFGPSLHEDTAGNPAHLLIAGFAVLGLLWRRHMHPGVATYAACVAIGFLIFCGYLKWQFWNSRLHLPLFVAIAPVCGSFFTRGLSRKLMPVVAIVIICLGAVYATRNETRRLIWRSSILLKPRTDIYFVQIPASRDVFENASLEIVRGSPSRVGMISPWDDLEYPLRVLVQMNHPAHLRFEHVDVQNESRICAPDSPAGQGLPEKIVVFKPLVSRNPPPGYRLTFTSEELNVLERGN